MKNAAIPFVRQFGPGDSGPDVHAVKRALAAAGHGHGLSVKTGLYGKPAQAQLEAFKKAAHLPDTPVYDTATHRALAPFFDEFGASLLVKEATALAKRTGRDAFVDTLRWMVAHRSIFDYAEVRPIPLGLAPRETTSRIATDCSGSITLAAKWAGVTDPNGLYFSGEGFTGTMLSHCTPIARAQVLPGDLAVYGPNPGHHVCAVLALLPNDLGMFSHGHQGCPEEILNSVEAASQAANGHAGVTYLRFLPA